MNSRIALVDDDQNILASVSIALENEGYEVKTFFDSEQALIEITRNTFNLAVLDIKMPKLDGIELLRKIREKNDIPVIFLTSKDDELDEALGLGIGADDYITKPFSQRLLLARIKAVLRRSVNDRNKSKKNNTIIGNLTLDVDRHLCSWKENEIKLTVTEFLLLQSLASRPGHVKTRDQLMDAAYGDDVYLEDRTIDSHIKRIRRKFKLFDNEFNKIETLYGIGYKYKL